MGIKFLWVGGVKKVLKLDYAAALCEYAESH